MNITMSKQVKKHLDKCDNKTCNRLQKTIDGLATFDGDIKKLEGSKNDYRLKKPPYRILFTYIKGSSNIHVDGIYPRGDAYKKG